MYNSGGYKIIQWGRGAEFNIRFKECTTNRRWRVFIEPELVLNYTQTIYKLKIMNLNRILDYLNETYYAFI